ncbi:hypothetical protein [Proteus mirabilis]|uniref:hypothetical protein n=1 Tax=Proteus mirabilis TaxID=584 RepID=UPI0034D47ACD
MTNTKSLTNFGTNTYRNSFSNNCRLFLNLPKTVLRSKAGRQYFRDNKENVSFLRRVLLSGAEMEKDVNCNYGIVVTFLNPRLINVTVHLLEIKSAEYSKSRPLIKFIVHKGKRDFRDFVNHALQNVETIKVMLKKFDKEIHIDNAFIQHFNKMSLDDKINFASDAFLAYSTCMDSRKVPLHINYNQNDSVGIYNGFNDFLNASEELINE